MLVLGIETTCDETAVSVVKEGAEILSNVISTQIDLHKKYKGVFPELACRRHLDDLLPVVEEALLSAEVTPEEIDLIAVADKPGLVGAILMGLSCAKALSYAWKKPYVGVNHLEAHLYAAMMPRLDQIKYPALGLVLSGGHTFMAKIEALGTYTLIGQTVDDAIGETFDKVASMMGLDYPGGPEIETLAKAGRPDTFPFKGGKVKGRPYDFSFSGLKTNVLYTINGQNKEAPPQLRPEHYPDLAASFQRAAFSDVIDKALLAAKAHDCHEIYAGGGVTQSQALKTLFSERSSLPVFYPPKGLSLDNGAMIAGLGYHTYKANETTAPLNLKATPKLKRTSCLI